MGFNKRQYTARHSRKRPKTEVEKLYDKEQLQELAESPPAILTLKFGPHAGANLDTMPARYVLWLLEHSGNFSPLAQEIINDYRNMHPRC